MNNTFGNILKITLFGESHSKVMGIVIDGMPYGIKIAHDNIKHELSLRRPASNDTSRVEEDQYEIISGVLNDTTTGAPLTILIHNKDYDNSVYENTRFTPRPSHADAIAYAKYEGFNDYLGGGRFSGRLTACLVACGAICKQILLEKNIKIASHILKVDNITDSSFMSINNDNKEKMLNHLLDNHLFIDHDNTVIDPLFCKLRETNDSIGGIIETVVTGLNQGIGEEVFNSIESMLSHAIFSIGGIKGIEFGEGFNFANFRGHEVLDEMHYEDGKIVYDSNHNGGIIGGLSTGDMIIFKSVCKPISSISKTVKTVNLSTKENVTLKTLGRHDVSIIRRVIPVINSVTAIVLLDLLLLAKTHKL